MYHRLKYVGYLQKLHQVVQVLTVAAFPVIRYRACSLLSLLIVIDQGGTTWMQLQIVFQVLLALERIDQDEGLTYEQILSLETNSLLGGLNLYDQHRDMRDIDNMSYEELLALEERMGIVSTALSEEELSEYLRISIYKPLHMKQSRMRGSWCLHDTKCSIRQEEFIAGGAIGRMGCDHGYHTTYIAQWLRLKNWCPICKISAKPSNSW